MPETKTFKGQGQEADDKANAFIHYEAAKGNTWKEYGRHDEASGYREIRLRKETKK